MAGEVQKGKLFQRKLVYRGVTRASKQREATGRQLLRERPRLRGGAGDRERREATNDYLIRTRQNNL